MKKEILASLAVLTTLFCVGQTTSQAGQWTTNANWVGGTHPGNLTINAGDDNLQFNNQTIDVEHKITVGSTSNRIDMTFPDSGETGSLTISQNDTLIVYGDVTFANKSMDLILEDNSVMIVMGDMSVGNKVDVGSTGILVVSGQFSKNGSQGSYTGTGSVYAGSYGGGQTDGFIPGDTGSPGDQQQTLDDLSSDGFSEIEDFVNEGGATPLPVELLYFNISASKTITLSWATASEINNDYFQIERSEDGINFYEIGRVNGNGNSSEQIEYEFEDKFPLTSIEYYRLKQVDFDGQFEHFEIKRINTGIEDIQTKISAYPTVVKNDLIKLTSNAPFQIQQITMYSLSGGEAKSLHQNTIQENPLNYQVNTSNVGKGIYLLKVITSEGAELSTRIIVD